MSVLNDVMDMESTVSAGRVDTEDAVLAPFYTLGTAATTSVATVSIFGTSLGSQALSVGGASFSWAFVVSATALVLAWVTNEMSIEDVTSENGSLETSYRYLVIGTVAIHLGLELVPEFSSAVVGSDPISVAILAILSAGYYTISYLG